MTHVQRPNGGFFVRYTPPARQKLDEIAVADGALARRVTALVDRIALIGHIDGFPLDENEQFLNRIMSDTDKAGDVVSVLYGVMGDSATIRGISTWPKGET